MTFRSKVRRAIEKALQLRIYHNPPRGADPFYDFGRSLSKIQINTIFDVGANIGQSAIEYATAFPQAKIFSFEPIAETFAQLNANVAGIGNIKTFHTALGATIGEGAMLLEGPSSMYRLTNDTSATSSAAPTQSVSISTLDNFCEQNGIKTINYLKIDTEGSDLKVLQGSESMISAQNIDIVQVEAGMTPANDLHVPFQAFVEYMSQRNYQLFALTEQQPSFTPKAPYIYRADAIFISQRVVDLHS